MKIRTSIYYSLMMVCLTMWSTFRLHAQQNREIGGTVKDAATGATLTGVSVRVTGKSQATATDETGRFVLQAAQGDVLVFSYLGYVTQEVSIGTSSTYTVNLQPAESEELGEVVVTALGIERQTRSLSYATQRLSADQLNEVRDNSGNLMNSLSGKVAGAVITPAATGPGGAARIVLRGNRSISGNNNALIVVDGVPIDNSANTQANSTFNSYGGSDGAANLNPDDIESVNILKGATAAALYGSRAANGAIVVTTKRGKEGKLAIDYNGGVSIDQPNLLMDFQNTYGRGNGGEAGATAGESWGAPTTTYPDNVQSVFRTATTVNNAINISGGTENMQGYASYTNNHNSGILPGNDLDRNTLNLRVNNTFFSKLNTDAKITYLNQKISNKPRLGDTGTPMGIYIMPRDMSESELRDFEGTDPVTGEPTRKYWTTSSIFDNPYWDLNRTSVNEERNRITLLGSATYQATEWLRVLARYSFDRYDDWETGRYYNGTVSLGNVQPGGQYFENSIVRSERNIDVLFSGDHQLSTDFSLTYNVGGSLLNRKSRGLQNMANGLSIPNQFNLAFATTPAFNNVSIIDRELQSVYGSAQVNFKDYLYLDLSARNDWSSTLPAPHSYFYPSIGLSAILSDALSLPNWVSFGKVRASYTEVGNDAAPYLLNQLYNFSLGAGQGFVSRNLTRAINNLRPENTQAYEVGLDWRFLNDRLGVEATFYKTNTINQLLFIGLPLASGYSNQYINAGDIENKGVELQLNGTPVRSEQFSWNTYINFSHNVNKILKLADQSSRADLSTSTRLASVVAVEGGSYGDLYGYAWEKDANGNHLVNDAGLPIVKANTKIGNFNPDFLLGWGNTLNYGQFSLSFLIDGRVGGEMVSGTDSFLGAYGLGDYTAQYRDGGLVLPGVKADGTPNTTAVDAQTFWTAVSQNGRDAWGEFFTYSTTNFRLREASLGYEFPLNGSAFKRAQVSVTGRNLFFLYRGKSTLDIPGMQRRTIPIDPEAALGINNYQGVEAGLLPPVRSFGLNVKLSF
ncbi:SusC/RagA family TonB-linked outer membrane protein [Parapedobacter pyrenivorans]|uniref:SusC/RagA family TonB-linked outer membrane protein n=1 Tax=Parapedobacter pyrenivorans TaxID=1305674 RepID=A0A917M2C5_9SPHI|nr:SusC/RagA family TonB-linked outer membrane protein [Parapedobacter pyrenivorans]GGG73430.1 SusC/RagA family TonB-linked outer membrane protein [Parapedobacter pyrenivorans]